MCCVFDVLWPEKNLPEPDRIYFRSSGTRLLQEIWTHVGGCGSMGIRPVYARIQNSDWIRI